MQLAFITERLDQIYPLYSPKTGDNNRRFVLGTKGQKPLVVIGLNPSYADKERSDRTITRVQVYAERHDYDSFIMLNLSAQRTPHPTELLKDQDEPLHRQNMTEIAATLHRFQSLDILAAWGLHINSRTYLKHSLREILDIATGITVQWLQVGPTLTKHGHPRHPSRGKYVSLTPFDIDDYIRANFRL